MSGKRLQSIIHMIGMILVMFIVSMNILDYQIPKIFSYLMVLIAAVYFLLVFKNRYKV